MELEADFVLMDKVHMTLIPVALFSVLLANKDTITWQNSDCERYLYGHQTHQSKHLAVSPLNREPEDCRRCLIPDPK